MRLDQHGMKPGERQVGQTLGQIATDHVKRYRWAIQKLSGRRLAGCSVMDLGCGVGYGSALLYDAGFHVVGVDNDANAIKYAREVWGFGRDITWVHGEALTDLRSTRLMPPRVTVALEVLEHLDAPSVLAECRSPLLVASVPNQDAAPWSAERYPYHLRHYSPRDFTKLLADAGYTAGPLYTQRSKRDFKVNRGSDGAVIMTVATRAST